MKNYHICFSIIILLCLINPTTKGQQPNYTLQTNLSGSSKEYRANDFIRLKNGFVFTAGNTKSFKASIEHGLPTLPTINSYADKNGNITINPQDGGVVGTIPGNFNVSGGNATYNIPIEVPPGIKGMEPQISLAYNSNGGDGICGIGWSVNGLSMISIGMKNWFTDGEISRIGSAYNIDGNRLLIKSENPGFLYSGTTGTYNEYPTNFDSIYIAAYQRSLNITGNTYETENKTHTQITTNGIIPYVYISVVKVNVNHETFWKVYWSETTITPRYFKVLHKDGTTTVYSPTKNVDYISNKESKDINYQWIISAITDPNGNTVNFNYEYNEDQPIIKSIQYASSQKVVFNYSTDSIQKKKRFGDYYSELKYYLQNIQLYSNQTLLKQYDLSYAIRNDNHYLEHITLTGQNNIKLNATDFTWGEDNRTLSVTTTPATMDSNQQQFDYNNIYWFSDDLNADGADDIYAIYPALVKNNNGLFENKNILQTFRTKLNHNQITFEKDSAIYLTNFSFSNLKKENSNIFTGDFDGDGKKEFLQEKISEGLIKYLILNKGIEYLPVATGSFPVTTVADFNNDGKDDIIFVNNSLSTYLSGTQAIFGNGWYADLNIIYNVSSANPTLSKSTILISQNEQTTPDKLFCRDFNNDGLKDILIGDASGYTKLIANEIATIVNFNQPQRSTDAESQNIRNTGDFDNDGLVDILSFNENSGVWSVKTGSEDAFSNMSLFEVNSDLVNEDYVITDFNHDGKSDLIITNKKYAFDGTYLETSIGWFHSTGNSFETHKTVKVNDENYNLKKFNTTGDIDGDGRLDVISYGSDIYNGTSKSDNIYLHRSFNTAFEGNRIKTISDGLSNSIHIKYQPITYSKTPEGKQFYTKGNTAVYPVIDAQLPVYCVKETSTSDGAGGNSVTEYAYSQARIHLTGRGFLGFKTENTSNSTLNRKSTNTTELNLTYCLPDSITTQLFDYSGGIPYSKTVTSFSNTITNKILESKLSKKVSHDFLTTLNQSVEYQAYDNYGNPTQVITTQGNITNTQMITYIQKGSFCPNKPEYITSNIKQGVSDSVSRIQKFEYDVKGNLIKTIKDPGDQNQLITEYKNWTTYGQPTLMEISANGKTRQISISMTPSGRFVAAKTDVTGQTTAYDWDETRALLKTETSRPGITSYTYNGLGQLTNTVFPDGTSSQQTAQWASSDNGLNAKFYVFQQASGAAPVYTWFDAKQREIVKETYGLNGSKSRVFTEYMANGKTKRVSAPTFNYSAESWDAEYGYFADGRIHTVTTPVGNTSYAYSGLTTTVIAPDGTQQTVLNSAGQVYQNIVNGKSVTYDYYASGLAKTVTAQGGKPLSMEYDMQGNRTKLTDPDTGETLAHYTGFGELDWEKITNNATQGQITMNYIYHPATGLIDKVVKNNQTTQYTYDTSNRLSNIEIAGKHKQTITYGDYDRVTSVTELIGGTKTLTKNITYDNFGRVKKETFPTGYYTENHYDEYGNLYQVTDNHNPVRVIWKASSANARGQITRELKGAKETVYGYDETKGGLLTSITATGIINYGYTYDNKMNVDSRIDYLSNQKEQFTYDGMNRLTNWDVYDATYNYLIGENFVTYDAKGNITEKTDMNYSPDYFSLEYGDNNKPHKLTGIGSIPEMIPATNQEFTYTDFRKIQSISEPGKNYTVSYGVDEQRRKTVYTNETATVTRYYFGNYEEESDNIGNTRKFHYLSGGAILINNNGVETLYYGYADNQGSLVALTNENGTVVEKYAYDPWGVRRNPDDWLQTDGRTSRLTNRGYTGHEHLDMFGIINMNGRVYDPATAMFFSPDPFVQSPGNWLNYNRYAYVMHNPLKFTDPSGYYPKELGNHPSPVTSDYNHDYTYGLGGGGFGQAEPNPFSFNTWWNAYIFASRKGYNGGLSNFQQQYFNPDAWNNDKLTLENHYWTQNSETRNSEFYKVSTKHTTFVTINLNGNSSGQGGISINWRYDLVDGAEKLNDIAEGIGRSIRNNTIVNLTKLNKPMLNGLALGIAFEKDKYNIGRNTIIQGTRIGVGIVASYGGVLVGQYVGGMIGGGIGFLLGGFNAVPGVIIGKAVGGAIGGYFTVSYSSDLVDAAAIETE